MKGKKGITIYISYKLHTEFCWQNSHTGWTNRMRSICIYISGVRSHVIVSEMHSTIRAAAKEINQGGREFVNPALNVSENFATNDVKQGIDQGTVTWFYAIENFPVSL